MIILFNKEECGNFFNRMKMELSSRIDGLSNNEIINGDLNKWSEYFYDIYKVEPIDLFIDEIEKTNYGKKVESYGNGVSSRSNIVMVDGYELNFTIPFDGDENLLYLRPSKCYSIYSKVALVKQPTETEKGKIIIALKYRTQELDQKEDASEIISCDFKRDLQLLQNWIENINLDVEKYNLTLNNSIPTRLNQRKQKAESYIALNEKLNIPIILNPNAPNKQPISLKRKVQKNPQRPSTKAPSKEYEISDEDYKNIKSIISLAGASFEKTAQTFIKLSEEELRDVVISHLNTHYKGMVTGETFRRVGKTDIQIPFENKSAYVGECKIWHGEKQVLQALEQLFSYTTWRDSKTSLIIFNKKNKDFKNLTDTLDKCLKKHDRISKYYRTLKNEWECQFIKEKDYSEIISVHIVIFDLYVNEEKK